MITKLLNSISNNNYGIINDYWVSNIIKEFVMYDHQIRHTGDFVEHGQLFFSNVAHSSYDVPS
jgi:hypothetical protein